MQKVAQKQIKQQKNKPKIVNKILRKQIMRRRLRKMRNKPDASTKNLVNLCV